MASGDVLMDWEPDVPGQFNTPHRLRRKRTVEELDSPLDLEPPFLDTFHPSQVPSLHQPRAGFFASVLLVTYRIVERLFAFPIARFKARKRDPRALNDYRQIVEIRSLASDGYESVKRRSIGARKPIVSQRQQTRSEQRLPLHLASPSPMTSVSSSSGRKTLQHRTSEQMADLSQDTTMSGALGTFAPSQLHSTPSDTRSSVPGADALSRIRLSLNPPALPGDGISHSNKRLTFVESVQDKKPNPSRRPNGRKTATDGRMVEDGYDRGKNTAAEDQWRATHIGRSNMISGHPQQDDSEVSNTSTGERHVRIALNPHNGLPQERVVKFFKESMIGEWAPSSPWSIDQVNNAQTNLEGNLLALIQDTTSPLPPATPPPNDLKSSSRTIASANNIVVDDQDRSNSIDGSESRLRDAIPLGSSAVSTSVAGKSLQRSLRRPPSDPAIGDHSIVASNDIFLSSSELPDLLSTPRTHTSGLVQSETSEHDMSSRVPHSIIFATPSMEVDGAARVDEQARDSIVTPLSTADDVADMFLELAMSDSMKDKRAERKKRRDEVKAAKRAAEEAAAARAKEEAERESVTRRTLRRMPKQKFIQALSEHWETRIDEAMGKGEHIALTTTVNGTELRRKDLMTVLGEREWLNDEIINAYLEWIVEYANEKAGKNGRTSIPKVIAHNSFFYKKIATDGPKSVSRWMKRKRAEGKKLLQVEQVLIPVNNAAHWTLLVVSPKTRTVEYLDSFGGPSKVFIRNTLAWLEAELGDAWVEDEWQVLDTRSAQQFNGYDCGVFTITNAECVAGSILTDSYDAGDMAAQRRRIAAVLLNRGFGGELVAGQEL